MKKYVSNLILIVVFCVILGATGCSFMPTVTKPLTYPETLPIVGYNLDYAPVKEANPIPATIAQIAPSYGNSNSADISFTVLEDSVKRISFKNEEITKICDGYLNSVKSDFSETLIAKGYTLLGPFSNIEGMTYGEKEKSDLVLISKINLKFQFIDTATADNKKFEVFSQSAKNIVRNAYGKNVLSEEIQLIAKLNGTLMVDGFIELILLEPLTGEKMWIKQIKVPFEKESYFYYVFQKGVHDIDIIGNPISKTILTDSHIINESDFRPRALAKVLEKVYISQLDMFNKYFDPKEISFVLKDAEKIRKLKRY